MLVEAAVAPECSAGGSNVADLTPENLTARSTVGLPHRSGISIQRWFELVEDAPYPRRITSTLHIRHEADRQRGRGPDRPLE